MYEYLEKNFDHSNWFYESYYGSKLNNLQGNIKFMKQTKYWLNRDTNELEFENGTASFSFEFNREKEIITALTNEEKYETKYRNFKEGKIISQRHCPDNSFELYEYDEATGLSNKYITINREGIRTEYPRTIQILKDQSILYSDKNFMINYDQYGRVKHNKVNTNFEYVYDYLPAAKKGYYIKTSFTNEKISCVEKYNYDDYIIEVVMYRNNSVSNKKMMFYDETDKLIQDLTFFDDDSFESHYYFYNDIGLLIEDKICSEGRKTGTCDFFEYDIHNNVIRTRDNSFQYTYDKNGNWTERLELSNGVVICKIIREFEYFPFSLRSV